MLQHWRVFLLVTLVFMSKVFPAMATVPAQDSQPLIFLPFENGVTVRCVQAPGGTYSHQGGLYYSYDFDMGSSDNSASNPIFGENLLSPVNGTIIDLEDGYADFQCNTGSTACNNFGWGNTLVIQPDNSQYLIRISHLRDGSIPGYLRKGDHVDQGDLLGQVGQTGYSSHPHLHIHITPVDSTTTIKFEFVEGPMGSYTWVTSQLEANKYILDNDRRTNLGAPLSSPNNWYDGSFSLYTAAGDAHGDDYRRSVSGASGSQRYYWAFTTQDYEGRVDVYANCRVMSSSNDNSAQYRVYGGGLSIYETVNQTSYPYWHLASSWLQDYTRYYIRVSRGNSSRRVCADSIIIYLDDE